ncbi:MAG: polyprenyl synthetase family protein [Gemmatimonadetes bacterium]|uniref:Polyprenyl synthetase family protein n=1 Tax=Candidatus Kutchimonas denitrificans TaxID=3056748 RepID=A0AAE5CCA8_9BACT|nr:polyprenyl synthetase family protein [Gemmatimonadota bacterium]NIR73919.1 polyprenyl synthetase family protein [Candidatus Kutchimonas denitrificans]NIR99725.1 polyprenyl synthetase family protein [Gemmatimonadota bacterium]NIT65310.1 polyprenyl synthetase family protein [Gemmatimonadota bacterium]NIW73759.1 octaprenyl-diphosphate synthase [Gemmatimonadota bacterium]
MRDRLDELYALMRQLVADEFELIDDINDHLLLKRGKLFRPTLLLLSNEIGGRPSRDAIRVAAVVEAVHLATLVHDDAVDHSALRRGMPTVNSLWGHQVAIIMGDFLYSRSVVELSRLGRVELIQVLAEAANTMTIGEMRQLVMHDSLAFTEDDYYRLISAKTAALMSAACELGALVGAPEYREPLKSFGYALGMAFQIADDILDYTGSEDVTGKPSGQDLREHKVTLPLIAALPNFDDEQRLAVSALFADPEPEDGLIARVIEATEQRGGVEFARAGARAYADEALSAIADLPESPAAAALADAVGYAVDRRQ